MNTAEYLKNFEKEVITTNWFLSTASAFERLTKAEFIKQWSATKEGMVDISVVMEQTYRMFDKHLCRYPVNYKEALTAIVQSKFEKILNGKVILMSTDENNFFGTIDIRQKSMSVAPITEPLYTDF